MRTRALIIALLSAITLAACGSGDEETPSSTPAPAAASEGGGETLKLIAEEPGEEEFAFDPAELDAKAGAVTIDLELPADLKEPHAIAIEGDGVDEFGETVGAGATSSVTADLAPGEYTFYCPVSDHRVEGMEGTLTVG